MRNSFVNIVQKLCATFKSVFHTKKFLKPLFFGPYSRAVSHRELLSIGWVWYLCIQPKTKLYNHLGFQFSDFQFKSFVDPKPVDLHMRECYIPKVASKQACLIAKIKLEKSVQL